MSLFFGPIAPPTPRGRRGFRIFVVVALASLLTLLYLQGTDHPPLARRHTDGLWGIFTGIVVATAWFESRWILAARRRREP